MRSFLPVLAAALLLAGCTASPESARAPEPSSPAPTTASGCPIEEIPAPDPDAAFNQELHDELVAMLERDQAERIGTAETEEGDQVRTDRLAELVAEHGWPSIPMVGKDGEDAAWAIAQHSDLDPDFQCAALEYLREAVDAGVASGGNLAFLEDRVAVAAGKPQVYGTQIQCGSDGTPQPVTPIADEANVEQRRADAGLQSLADYYAEMAAICAEVEG
jgi:hypothetical protein